MDFKQPQKSQNILDLQPSSYVGPTQQPIKRKTQKDRSLHTVSFRDDLGRELGLGPAVDWREDWRLRLRQVNRDPPR